MSEFFIGFAGAPQLVQLASQIDRIAKRHGEHIRSQPHVGVTVLRSAPDPAVIPVQSFVDLSTGHLEHLTVKGRPLTVVQMENGDRHIAIELEDVACAGAVEQLRHRFFKRFNYARDQDEDRLPFISLLSSRDVPVAVFDAICHELRYQDIRVPEAITFSRLVLYDRLKDGLNASFESALGRPKAAAA